MAYPDDTYGYAYAAPGHLPGEPAIPLPEGPPDPSAGPANRPYLMDSGVVAARYTQGYHERQQELDRQAQAARMARDMAMQDAQMADQMMRVATSTKDIEIAKRSIDVMGLQRDIQNGVPIHEAVARHPMALGSGFGAALKNTEAPGKTSWVPPTGGAPGYVQDPRGTPHFPPQSQVDMPVDTKVEVAKDPETGKRIGLFNRTGPRTQHLILDATNKAVTPGDKIRIYGAIQRGILQQLNSIEGMLALKSPAHPKHAYYVGQQEKLAGIQLQLEALGSGASPTINNPSGSSAPAATNKIAGRFTRNKDGKLEFFK
jgi:hypothetical protein